MNGIESIAAERQRQIEAEGWTPEHDDNHVDGSIVDAALAYLTQIHGYHIVGWAQYLQTQKWVAHWPASWARDWYKPTNARIDLIKVGALIAAEIDRRDRKAAALHGMADIANPSPAAQRKIEGLLKARGENV